MAGHGQLRDNNQIIIIKLIHVTLAFTYTYSDSTISLYERGNTTTKQ